MATIRAATPADLPAILDIHNEAIENTTAIWDETPVDLADRVRWYEHRVAAGHPVLVAETAGASPATPATGRSVRASPTATRWRTPSTCTATTGAAASPAS